MNPHAWACERLLVPELCRTPTEDTIAEAAREGATTTAGETTANNTEAEAAVGAISAGARFDPPPEGGSAGRNDGIACQRQGGEIQPQQEGGTAGRDEEIARLLRENLELLIRAEIQAEERDRAQRMQERRYQGNEGGMNSSEQCGQPGTFIAGFGKLAPKLENKAGSSFTSSKQFIT